MILKVLSVSFAAFAAVAASSVFATGSTDPKPTRSIDPGIPTSEYRFALLEVDHKLDNAAMHQLGRQLSLKRKTQLDSVTKAIAGNGKFKVQGNPASVLVVEGEHFPLVVMEGVARDQAVAAGKSLEAVPTEAKVGYILDVEETKIDGARRKMHTTIRFQQSVLADTGSTATTSFVEQDTMGVGDVRIMSWELAGKQYAMAIRAEHF